MHLFNDFIFIIDSFFSSSTVQIEKLIEAHMAPGP